MAGADRREDALQNHSSQRNGRPNVKRYY
jgi:hypothetical protein